MTAEVPVNSLIALVTEWHQPAAYICAFCFPAWRWIRRKYKSQPISMESVIHQSATGFVVPAFVVLLLSYSSPSITLTLSPHETGIAGLFALITCLRELCVDGVV